MTRGGMARHLRACPKRKQAVSADDDTGAEGPLVHLQVEDAWTGQYWLHLEMNGSAPLEELDAYLRAIWLECCGHMSRFSAGGWGTEEIAMRRKAGQVFRPGMGLVHIYDFGTESVTFVKVVDVRRGKPTTFEPIALMARNSPPVFLCQECGGAATKLCLECVYEHDGPGALCEVHAEAHPHDEYGDPIALVNSPRVGMCGYDGPAEPPY
jgi:hypothetical protein